MPRDLSKVKEIYSANIDYSAHYSETINGMLKSGKWILLEVRVVERQEWRGKGAGDGEAHLRKTHETICVIGRIK